MTHFEDWGHWSQVVWQDSKVLGCYTQFCPQGTMSKDMDTWYTVCNYYPAGKFCLSMMNVQSLTMFFQATWAVATARTFCLLSARLALLLKRTLKARIFVGKGVHMYTEPHQRHLCFDLLPIRPERANHDRVPSTRRSLSTSAVAQTSMHRPVMATPFASVGKIERYTPGFLRRHDISVSKAKQRPPKGHHGNHWETKGLVSWWCLHIFFLWVLSVIGRLH